MNLFRRVCVYLLFLLVLTACPAQRTPTPLPSPTRATAVPATQTPPRTTPTTTPVAGQLTPTLAPVPAGWIEHQTADFRLQLPETWQVLALSQGDLKMRFADFQRENPLLAGIIGSADALEGVALWAFGPMDDSTAFADNLNIRRTSLGGQSVTDMAPVIAPIVEQYRLLNFEGVTAETHLRIHDQPAAHITYSFPFLGSDGAPGQVTGHQYFVATEADLWILSYAAGPNAAATAGQFFAQSAQSFQVR